MPGRIVTELERRYGRPGNEVLGALRSAIAASGRVRPEDVDRIAAETGLPRAHVNAAASFYSDLAPSPHGRRHVRVCAGTACFAASGGEHLGAAAKALGDRRRRGLRRRLGLAAGRLLPRLLLRRPRRARRRAPLRRAPTSPASSAAPSRRRDPEVPDRRRRRRAGRPRGARRRRPRTPGSTWERVRGADAAATISREVNASGLRGRGGAGFPAAVKWRAASEAPSDGPRYLICNGDEGDPGSFVDRLLMERDPQRILEGMALAGDRLRIDPRDRLRALRVPAGARRPPRGDRRGAGRRPARRPRHRLRRRGVRGRGLLRRRRGDLADPLGRGPARRGRLAAPLPDRARLPAPADRRQQRRDARARSPGSSTAAATPTPASGSATAAAPRSSA